MPTNELLAENECLRERLKVAKGLLEEATVGFTERQSDDSGAWDVCMYCGNLAKPLEPILHTGSCLVPRIEAFLHQPEAEGADAENPADEPQACLACMSGMLLAPHTCMTEDEEEKEEWTT